jgi:type 1 glutamine amidotransferase
MANRIPGLQKFGQLFIVLIILFFGQIVRAEENQIDVLIVQLFDLHDLRLQADVFEKVLKATGDYNIEVVIAKENQNWGDLDIQLSNYDLIISSLLGWTIPENKMAEFDQYISNGGNLVVIHQGVLSFENWTTFYEIVGLGWYKANAGYHIIWDDEEKKWIKQPEFHGVGPGHGFQHEFLIEIRNDEHPITKGMPKAWLHGMDEFYHGLRGAAKNIEILATSYSAKEQWGSGDHEPIAWTVHYGKGRVFVTMLGHAFLAEKADIVHGVNHYANESKGVYCLGFQTLFARGAQWAATGEVTIGIPANFPTKNSSVVIPPDKVKWE